MRAHHRLALAAGLAVLCVTPAALGASLPGTKTLKDRSAWRAILHWPDSCEAHWRVLPPPGAGVHTWRAPKGRRLVVVTCTIAAYQSSSMLYVVNAAGHPSKAIRLHTHSDTGNGKLTATRTTRPLGNASFTSKTATLWIVTKFRGAGDCGISSKFRLSGQRLVPTVSRAKTACDGKPPFDLDRWPKQPRLSPWGGSAAAHAQRQRKGDFVPHSRVAGSGVRC